MLDPAQNYLLKDITRREGGGGDGGREGYHLPAGRWMLTVFSDLMCDTATVARPPAVNRLSAACLLFFPPCHLS